MICKHILAMTYLNHIDFFSTQFNDLNYCYIIVTMEDQSFVCTQLVIFDP